MDSFLDAPPPNSLAQPSSSDEGGPDRGFSALVELVTRLCDLPIVLITAEPKNAQSFHIWGQGRPLLNQANCTLPFSVPENIAGELFILDDAQAPSPTGPYPPEYTDRLGSIRFAAHAPLEDAGGALSGHLWLMAPDAPSAAPLDAETLRHLASLASSLLSDRPTRTEQDAWLVEAALDALPDSFFVFDEEGHLMHWNAELNASTGYSDDEIATMHISDFFEDPDRTRVAQAIQQVWDEGTATVEASLCTRSGEKVPREFSGSLLRDANGAVHGICGIGRDITERKQTEQQLRQLTKEYATVFERAQDALFFVDVTESGSAFEFTFLRLNPLHEELTGLSTEEVRGRTPTELLGAETGAEVEAHYLRCVEERSTIEYEETLSFPKKTITWHTKLSPVIVDGAVTQIVGAARDITERKEMEQELRQSRERWQALVERHPASIMIIGSDETIKYANASTAAIYGAESPDEIIGRSIFDFLPDDYRPDIYKQREKLECGESTAPIRHPIRQLDGSKRIVESFSTPTIYDGEPAAQTVLRDVTEVEERERELQRAKETAEEMSQVKSTFLANMSHEIRTPLTSILGFSEVLADKVDDEASDLVRIITESGQRLKETLNAVLNLAELEGGTMQIEFEAVDLAERVREAERLFSAQAEQKGLEFTTDLPSDAPIRARLDRTALDRILSNLISNALKFTKEGGVSIQVEGTPDEAILHVEDTGVGIDDDFLPHLFDEFKQESDGMGREFEGAGLGLTITKRLVSLMQGTIEVESEKDVGTTFTLRFPLFDPSDEPTEAPTATAPQPEPEPEESAEQRRILAVEDNNATRRLMARMLEPDYIVDTAANATAALDHVSQESYDAILLDINLGERRTGVEVLHEIRKLPRYDGVPVVACTAYALQNHARRFMDAGFTSVIPKPFTKHSLIDGLADAFETTPNTSATEEEWDLEDIELPPLPTTLPEVVDLISTGDTNPDLERLSRILKQDPIISFWLLRHINSAYYNLRNKISTVDRAVTFLGFRPVCNLVLTEVLTHHLGDAETPLAKNVQDYLIRTGLGAALYAKKLGEFLDVADPEVVYAGGMLSQLGRFLLLSKDPKNYADLWTLTEDIAEDEEEHLKPPPLGQEILHCGVDSVRLGAQVARTHHFSDELRTIIQFAHQPNQSLEPDRQILTLTAALSLQAAQDLHTEGGWDAFSDCRTRLDGSALVQLTSLCEVPAEEVLYTIYEQQDDVTTFIETISRD